VNRILANSARLWDLGRGVAPWNCMVVRKQIFFARRLYVRFNSRCTRGDETEIYTQFLSVVGVDDSLRSAITRVAILILRFGLDLGLGAGCWLLERSGVARLQQARVARIPKDLPSSTHRVRVQKLIKTYAAWLSG